MFFSESLSLWHSEYNLKLSLMNWVTRNDSVSLWQSDAFGASVLRGPGSWELSHSRLLGSWILVCFAELYLPL